MAADGPTWSAIDQGDDKPQGRSIFCNEPVRHADGSLRVGIGIAFILPQLTTKLAAIWGERAGADGGSGR